MSTIVERFLTDELKVTRPGPGKYIKGKWHPGPPETLIVYGSRQALSARELKMVTEGTRFKQAWRYYTDQSLSAGDPTDQRNSDIIEINGERFKVISVESWENFDLEYFKSILAREPEQKGDAP